jgi:uncharacterized caspase-like protein
VVEIRRRALLIGVENYEDDYYAPLPCVKADLRAMRAVLEDPGIGGYVSPVQVLTDPSAAEMRDAIALFLAERHNDELAVLYLTGHGHRLRATTRELVFIARDTQSTDAESTGVSARFVSQQLEKCRAAQRIAILDCCYSGGFALGLRTRDDPHDDEAEDSAANYVAKGADEGRKGALHPAASIPLHGRAG